MTTLIAAVDSAGGMARGGQIPWHHAGDLRLFRTLTLNKRVFMGARTYATLPAGGLPGRECIVLSRTDSLPQFRAGDCLIGGPRMIQGFTDQGWIRDAYITIVGGAPYDCDEFLPEAWRARLIHIFPVARNLEKEESITFYFRVNETS